MESQESRQDVTELRHKCEALERAQEEIKDAVQEIVTILQGSQVQRYQGLLDWRTDTDRRVETLEEAERSRRVVVGAGIASIVTGITNIVMTWLSQRGGTP